MIEDEVWIHLDKSRHGSKHFVIEIVFLIRFGIKVQGLLLTPKQKSRTE